MRELGVEEGAWWGKLCQGWLLVKENGVERQCLFNKCLAPVLVFGPVFDAHGVCMSMKVNFHVQSDYQFTMSRCACAISLTFATAPNPNDASFCVTYEGPSDASSRTSPRWAHLSWT